MSEEFPLYPNLSEEGKQEAQALIDVFKEKLMKAAKEAISNLYCDAADFIESDSWSNFRNTIIAGYQNYGNRHRQGEWDFAKIRTEIFKQFRDEIIPELNQDLVKENEELRKDIERLKEDLHRIRNY